MLKLFAVLRSSTLAILGTALIIGINGCSNPFSTPTPPNLFHSRSAGCDNINFKIETLTALQLRSIVGCLNSGHELDSVDELVNTVSDQDLEPFIKAFNQVSTAEPRFIYGLKEFYEHLKSSGRFKELTTLADLVLADSKRNQDVALVLSNHAEDFSKILFNKKLAIDLKAAYSITASPSFVRFMQENNVRGQWQNLIQSTQTYLATPGVMNVKELVDLLQKNKIDTQFNDIVKKDPKDKIAKIASLADWLFDQGRIPQFSRNLREMQAKPIRCMSNHYSIERPDQFFARELSKRNAREARHFISVEAKTMLLLSHGFCEAPYSFNAVISFFEDLMAQPAFEDIFEMAKPLLLNEKILKWIASPAVEKWAEQNENLKDRHFFYDGLMLVYQAINQPILKHGYGEIFDNADRILKNYSSAELLALIDFAQPLLTKEEKYGNHGIELLHSEVVDFPKLPFPAKLDVSNEELQKTIQAVLKNTAIPKVLNQVVELNAKGILEGLLNDTLQFFSVFIDRGIYDVKFVSAAAPVLARDSNYFLLLNKMRFVPSTEFELCTKLNLDWDFDRFASSQSSTYVKTIDQIFACLDQNSSFTKTKSFIHSTIKANYLPFILQSKDDLVNNLMSTELQKTYTVLHEFMKLPHSSMKSLGDLMNHGSALSSVILPSVKQMDGIRSVIAKVVEAPKTFEFAEEIVKVDTDRYPMPEEEPTLDLIRSDSIDLRLGTGDDGKPGFYNNIDYVTALRKTFERFCPSLDITKRDCDIDEDQLKDYLSNPAELAQKIKREYLNNGSNWIHPSQFKKWNHIKEGTRPQKVSDIEYHLYPILHNVKNNVNAVQSTIDFLEAFRKDSPHAERNDRVHHFDRARLYKFLKEKGTHLTMMPYIYQIDRDPRTAKVDHVERRRIRLASDLDQIELVAVNTDFIFQDEGNATVDAVFKKIGFVRGNMGMKLIAEVGFAMGDLDQSQWPSALSRPEYKKKWQRCNQSSKSGDDSCIRTLEQVKNLVYGEIGKFKIVTSFRDGCDQRDRNWIHLNVCVRQLAEIAARVANLELLLRFMDDKDTSEVLRDMFFFLHTASSSYVLNKYPDGMKLHDDCYINPSKTKSTNCFYDNLEMASLMTRVGFLHEVGLAIIKNKHTPIPEIINTLFGIQDLSPKTIQDIIDLFRTNKGIEIALNATDAAFEMDRKMDQVTQDKVMRLLGDVLKGLSLTENKHWLDFGLTLIKNDPRILNDNLDLMTKTATALLSNSKPKFSTYRYLSANPSSAAFDTFDLISSSLNDETAKNVASLLPILRSNQNKVIGELKALQAIDFPNSLDRLKPSVAQLLRTMATPSFAPQRKKLAAWVKSDNFNQLCDLFSDTPWVNQSFKSLEEIHQDPDTIKLLENMGELLHLQ